uniref:H(+)-transporting two-sector ATPase n=1 Tax=Welwitschia mirabilis TaxID=3377 RepID=A0A0X9SKE6_WELMI|nr:ATP synthase subunit 8 [Welwitschia mirabilis]AMA21011.1 ATP synthase subunit 8 [Welwitschia mirabilis]QXE44342.1 ATP synthase subunit 8 [Welwitschia mirabilis]
MPQLDISTYETQFFWLCLIFFTNYICLCNDGVPKISRILKLRNQLVPHLVRGNNICRRSNNPNSEAGEEILGRGVRTGVSYMYSSLFEVSQWCDAAHNQGRKNQITTISISRYYEISGSRRMGRSILYLIPSYSYSTYPNPLSGWRKPLWDKDNLVLIHFCNGQVHIVP